MRFGNYFGMSLIILEKWQNLFNESFKKLMEINGYVKTLTQLRQEAVIYQKYLAYQTSGSIYNPENINQQLEYLYEELNSAVILLKQEYEIQ